MAPTVVRLRRWADTSAALLRRQDRVPSDDGARPIEEQEELELPSLGSRTASLARAHPVATAWVVAAAVTALAYRRLIGPGPLTGGALAAFPGSPHDFFREFGSAVRTTGLGGTEAGSPALLATRRYYREDGTLIELSSAIHPSDRFTYVTSLVRG